MGVFIDVKLKFDTHINKLCSRCPSLLGLCGVSRIGTGGSLTELVLYTDIYIGINWQQVVIDASSVEQ